MAQLPPYVPIQIGIQDLLEHGITDKQAHQYIIQQNKKYIASISLSTDPLTEWDAFITSITPYLLHGHDDITSSSLYIALIEFCVLNFLYHSQYHNSDLYLKMMMRFLQLIDDDETYLDQLDELMISRVLLQSTNLRYLSLYYTSMVETTNTNRALFMSSIYFNNFLKIFSKTNPVAIANFAAQFCTPALPAQLLSPISLLPPYPSYSIAKNHPKPLPNRLIDPTETSRFIQKNSRTLITFLPVTLPSGVNYKSSQNFTPHPSPFYAKMLRYHNVVRENEVLFREQWQQKYAPTEDDIYHDDSTPPIQYLDDMSDAEDVPIYTDKGGHNITTYQDFNISDSQDGSTYMKTSDIYKQLGVSSQNKYQHLVIPSFSSHLQPHVSTPSPQPATSAQKRKGMLAGDSETTVMLGGALFSSDEEDSDNDPYADMLAANATGEVTRNIMALRRKQAEARAAAPQPQMMMMDETTIIGPNTNGKNSPQQNKRKSIARKSIMGGGRGGSRKSIVPGLTIAGNNISPDSDIRLNSALKQTVEIYYDDNDADDNVKASKPLQTIQQSSVSLVSQQSLQSQLQFQIKPHNSPLQKSSNMIYQDSDNDDDPILAPVTQLTPITTTAKHLAPAATTLSQPAIYQDSDDSEDYALPSQSQQQHPILSQRQTTNSYTPLSHYASPISRIYQNMLSLSAIFSPSQICLANEHTLYSIYGKKVRRPKWTAFDSPYFSTNSNTITPSVNSLIAPLIFRQSIDLQCPNDFHYELVQGLEDQSMPFVEFVDEIMLETDITEQINDTSQLEQQFTYPYINACTYCQNSAITSKVNLILNSDDESDGNDTALNDTAIYSHIVTDRTLTSYYKLCYSDSFLHLYLSYLHAVVMQRVGIPAALYRVAGTPFALRNNSPKSLHTPPHSVFVLLHDNNRSQGGIRSNFGKTTQNSTRAIQNGRSLALMQQIGLPIHEDYLHSTARQTQDFESSAFSACHNLPIEVDLCWESGLDDVFDPESTQLCDYNKKAILISEISPNPQHPLLATRFEYHDPSIPRPVPFTTVTLSAYSHNYPNTLSVMLMAIRAQKVPNLALKMTPAAVIFLFSELLKSLFVLHSAGLVMHGFGLDDVVYTPRNECNMLIDQFIATQTPIKPPFTVTMKNQPVPPQAPRSLLLSNNVPDFTVPSILYALSQYEPEAKIQLSLTPKTSDLGLALQVNGDKISNPFKGFDYPSTLPLSTQAVEVMTPEMLYLELSNFNTANINSFNPSAKPLGSSGMNKHQSIGSANAIKYLFELDIYSICRIVYLLSNFHLNLPKNGQAGIQNIQIANTQVQSATQIFSVLPQNYPILGTNQSALILVDMVMKNLITASLLPTTASTTPATNTTQHAWFETYHSTYLKAVAQCIGMLDGFFKPTPSTESTTLNEPNLVVVRTFVRELNATLLFPYERSCNND